MELKPISVTNFVELHKRLGLALWHSQAFEDTLARFITLILKLPPSRAEAEVLEVLEKLQSKTLGALIVELKKGNSTNSVSAFEIRIDRFLRERNWLVHKSWREHHADLFTPERLPLLLQRLEAMAVEAGALQKHFSELVRSWTLHQPGVTPEAMAEKLNQILSERGITE